MTKKKTTKPAPAKIVTREDVEKKLKEISQTIEEETSSSKDKLQVALIAAFGIGITLAFLAGRRRSLRKKTYVTFFKAR